MDLVLSYLAQEKPFPISFDPKNDKYAVIVEPRPLYYLPAIIWNVMRHLGPEWNLYIFGSSKNERFIKDNISGTFFFRDSGTEHFNSKTYSLFLRSLDFWEKIPGENIILFQTDSIMVDYLNAGHFSLFQTYGFIGSFYHYTRGQGIDESAPFGRSFNMNGGFSFRKKSVMMECIRKVSLNDIIVFRQKHKLPILYFQIDVILNEDVFFANAMSVLGLPLPTKEECGRLCIQNDSTVSTSRAIHGFQHPYLPQDLIHSYLQKDLKVISPENKNACKD